MISSGQFYYELWCKCHPNCTFETWGTLDKDDQAQWEKFADELIDEVRR